MISLRVLSKMFIKCELFNTSQAKCPQSLASFLKLYYSFLEGHLLLFKVNPFLQGYV